MRGLAGGVTPADVEVGRGALTMTVSESRLAENFAVFDLSLDAEETDAISGLAGPVGRIVNPEHMAPEWD
ncbi:MAG: hypothetical protein K0M47_22825 [Rhizobium sp.]|nr:hypothetical protein [Rhizobium sp.]